MTTEAQARENARSAWWSCMLEADWHGESDAFRAGWNAAITLKNAEIDRAYRMGESIQTNYAELLRSVVSEDDVLRAQRDALVEAVECAIPAIEAREDSANIRMDDILDTLRTALAAGKGEE